MSTPPIPVIFTLLQQPWQGPAAYWQAVASIMNLRGQTADSLLQHALQTCQQLPQCRSWPDYVALCSTFQAQSIVRLTNLAMNTQQQRMALWQTWQLLATRQTPQVFFSSWPQGEPAQPVASPTPQTFIPQTFTPQKQQPASPPQATASQPPATKPTHAMPTLVEKTAPTSPPQPTSLPQEVESVAPATAAVANAPTNAPLPFPTISRTGDAGVVRSSTGATIAAAAATRRSVVARRVQRKSKLARAR